MFNAADLANTPISFDDLVREICTDPPELGLKAGLGPTDPAFQIIKEELQDHRFSQARFYMQEFHSRRLLHACSSGNETAVIAYLTAGDDPNRLCKLQYRGASLINDKYISNRKNALHEAVAASHLNIVELLLAPELGERRANVNIAIPSDSGHPDDVESGQTALHFAALKGDVLTIKRLLKAGANVNAARQIEGFTPLILSIKKGHAEAVKTLIAGGASYKIVTPLVRDEETGELSAWSEVKHSEPTIFILLSALHVAIQQGDMRILTTLLESGFPVDNLASFIGDLGDTPVPPPATPLTWAFLGGNLDIIFLLEAYSANPNLVLDNPEKVAVIEGSLRNEAEEKYAYLSPRQTARFHFDESVEREIAPNTEEQNETKNDLILENPQSKYERSIHDYLASRLNTISQMKLVFEKVALALSFLKAPEEKHDQDDILKHLKFITDLPDKVAHLLVQRFSKLCRERCEYSFIKQSLEIAYGKWFLHLSGKEQIDRQLPTADIASTIAAFRLPQEKQPSDTNIQFLELIANLSTLNVQIPLVETLQQMHKVCLDQRSQSIDKETAIKTILNLENHFCKPSRMLNAAVAAEHKGGDLLRRHSVFASSSCSNTSASTSSTSSTTKLEDNVTKATI